ncbi:hypothetical protein H2201_006600 [Coniosporium apollinis]|uniref:glycerophosphodiester phosphodiesterase n=1 Tax=Coniosporium apollinis TaxID=61459 RepID=A0ABQ9NRQ1_9PEZI|nr:hypothetical protein H2201_006600 [Coniosporium apollinis]
MHLLTIASVSALVALTSALPAPAPAPTYYSPGRQPQSNLNVQLGPRPYYLVNDMDEGPLKDKLVSCKETPKKSSQFSLGHRGAPLQFPEHSNQSYHAAARTGAGVIECDVAFTSDRELVCRHSQCDLHYTTNILAIPELAAKCTTPFTPANGTSPATANCCTSDITLAEFKTLCAKMEAFNPRALNVSEYLGGTPSWRTDLYNYQCATPMSHKESIALIDSWGLDFTPELKEPSVEMPFQGNYTQADYAQQLIDEYKEAGIDPSRVWPQSFVPEDVFYWIENEPDFGRQAVYLDERVDTAAGYVEAVASLPDLAARGVKIMAPAIFALLNVSADGTSIVPSTYADAAAEAGLDIITWSLERSGPYRMAAEMENYYYASVAPVINNDGDVFTVVDVLAQQVGVLGIFSDWPATVTYYANCFGL